MFTCCTFYKKKYKSLIKKALEVFNDSIFLCWKTYPEFKIVNVADEYLDGMDEIELHICYSNPAHPESECEAGHLAFDLAQAFIEGVIYQQEIEDVASQ